MENKGKLHNLLFCEKAEIFRDDDIENLLSENKINDVLLIGVFHKNKNTRERVLGILFTFLVKNKTEGRYILIRKILEKIDVCYNYFKIAIKNNDETFLKILSEYNDGEEYFDELTEEFGENNEMIKCLKKEMEKEIILSDSENSEDSE